MMDIIYFELNNWFGGRDYPNSEPFISWCRDDLNLRFNNEEWVKNNELCVVQSMVDMSTNWCITASKSWVEQNCPDLLSDKVYSYETLIGDKNGTHKCKYERHFKDFLRYPDEYGDVEGRFGCPFLKYSEDNFGISYWDEYEGWLTLEDE